MADDNYWKRAVSRRRFLGGTAGTLGAAAFLAACGNNIGGGGADTIKIISSLPHTGSNKHLADTMMNSLTMAIEDAGKKAGSFTLQYEALDGAIASKGQWDAAKESENANKAVNDRNVMVYFGTYNSGAAKVSIPILNKADLVMISPGNTYPGLTKPGTGEPNEPQVYQPSGKINYVRVVPADDLQGAAGANWAKQLGARSAYILHDTQLYGDGIAKVFQDTSRKIGVEVKGYEGIDGKAADYRALAQKIRGTTPDLVFFGGITPNNAGKLWKDLRATLAPTVKLMGPDGIFEDAFLTDAGDAAEGTYVTFGGLAPDKLTGKGAEWYARYKDRFKSEPQAYGSYAYEAGNVIIAAIAKANKKDRAAIRDAIVATKDFEGVLGKWSFDKNGDTTLATMSGQIVKNGKFEFNATLSASA